MNTVAVIAARGGSKGVPRKNVKPLGGKPLIVWTIEAAKGAGIQRVFVSTEDKEISDISRYAGATVLARPHPLAADDVPSDEVYLFALRDIREQFAQTPEAAVLLSPTSPFRNSQHIQKALELFSRGTVPFGGTVFAGCQDKRYHWQGRIVEHTYAAVDIFGYKPVGHNPEKRLGRQWVDRDTGWLFVESGSLYVVSPARFFETRNYRIPPYTLCHIDDLVANVDIDEPIDWEWAEFLLEHGYVKKQNE